MLQLSRLQGRTVIEWNQLLTKYMSRLNRRNVDRGVFILPINELME